MAETIPFPGAVRAIGETFAAQVIRAGRSEAEHRGILATDVDAVTLHDRRFATYMLGQLGSRDPDHQRAGEFGLRRLIATMQDDAA
ncbi:MULTISPECIES: hypothetical protein [unclassified Methylobacterium]|uniref:hypothetical protein n=1 Tax=unclassified Methylobacterium TaxID=2615210 RepID=UPI0011C1F2CD|nr:MULTISPECIES: hypothetical protein [unclassified Methylobacterium]QEE37614.1 hypothetical protein FVA80_00230 [Methylobacterium sp. WL1]TXN52343.1 hypothetical protein FV241_29690 [Methylobacterium sp. WL2]